MGECNTSLSAYSEPNNLVYQRYHLKVTFVFGRVANMGEVGKGVKSPSG